MMVAMRYQVVQPPLDEATRTALTELYGATFGGEVASKVAHLEQAIGSRCWLAWDGPLLVGVKWGTERRPGEFHSNLGMVRPSHRRRGIARTLMRQQHAWARQQGYPRVTTNTYPHFLPMLLLDLDEGFEVVGLQGTESGLKLLLERFLGAEGVGSPDEAYVGGEVRGRIALAAALRAGHRVVGMRWDEGVVLQVEEDR